MNVFEEPGIKWAKWHGSKILRQWFGHEYWYCKDSHRDLHFHLPIANFSQLLVLLKKM